MDERQFLANYDSFFNIEKAPLGRRRSRSVGNLSELANLAAGPPTQPTGVCLMPTPGATTRTHMQLTGTTQVVNMLRLISTIFSAAEKECIQALDDMQSKIELMPKQPRKFVPQSNSCISPAPHTGPVAVNVAAPEASYGGSLANVTPLPVQSPDAFPGSMAVGSFFQPMASPSQGLHVKLGASAGAPYSNATQAQRQPLRSPPAGYSKGYRLQNHDDAQGLNYNHPIKTIARKRSSSLSCLPSLQGSVPVLNFDFNVNIPGLQLDAVNSAKEPQDSKAAKLMEFESFLDHPEPHISEAERKMGRCSNRERGASLPAITTINCGGEPFSVPSPAVSVIYENSNTGGRDVDFNLQLNLDMKTERSFELVANREPGLASNNDLDVPMETAFRQMSITTEQTGQVASGAIASFAAMGGSSAEREMVRNDMKEGVSNPYLECAPANRSASSIIREVFGEDYLSSQNTQKGGVEVCSGGGRKEKQEEAFKLNADDLYAMIQPTFHESDQQRHGYVGLSPKFTN